MFHLPDNQKRGLLKLRSPLVTLGVQAAVIDPDRRVLLVRHRYRVGWHFPGGGVERRETLEAALARELREEVGIELDGSPKLFGIYSHFDVFPGDHITLYIVEKWSFGANRRGVMEIAEHRFVALDAVPNGISAGTARRLAEIFDRTEIAETW